MRHLIGIPYRDGGRDPETGLDCWGLCMEAARCNGVKLPEFTMACYDALGIFTLFAGEKSSSRWTRVLPPVPGCIAVMAIDPDRPGLIQHLGLYIGDGIILHTLRKREAHLIKTDDRFFGPKIKGYYRWIG